MPTLHPMTTRLLVPLTASPPKAPAPAPMPKLAPPRATPMLLNPASGAPSAVAAIQQASQAAQAAAAITPAQAALPVTPAAAAALAALPDGTPSANAPGAMLLNPASGRPSAMAAIDNALAQATPPSLPPDPRVFDTTSARLPQTVSAALATIAQSAPSALAPSQGGGTIQTYDATRYTNAPQQRPPAQGNRSMSKTFTRTQRRIYCPINSGGTIALSTSSTITTRPQVNFQPDQLIVSPSIAAQFDIQSWSIGIQPQQAAAGNVCGDCFPAQNGPHFQFDVCDNGTDIIFNVSNLDTAAAHVFKGMLVGYQVDIQG